ncbi:hypothetical protein FM117_07655 [Micrococcus luteus Mu201]|nr:hypothetical protein FM117_07655 [Micrococcus luteus Mu201]
MVDRGLVRVHALRDRPEQDVGAGHPLEDLGEVLAAGLGLGQLPVRLDPVQVLHGPADEGHRVRVVGRHRERAVRPDLCAHAVRLGDPVHHALHGREQPGSGVRGEGTQGEGEGGAVRDDVGRRARAQVPDGRDHRVEGVELPGNHGLQRQHHLGGHGHRILGQVRHGAVPASTVHRHHQVVAAGLDRPRAAAQDAAQVGARGDMDRVGDVHRPPGRLQQPLLDHVQGAAAGLLPGLEHGHHVRGELPTTAH